MLALLWACHGTPGPGVVVVIADDLGVDALAAYADVWPGDERSYATTPTLDAICSDGLRFENAWSYPTCSPTRAAMLTGRHGYRTGIDGPMDDSEALAADEPFLPAVLASAGVRSGLFGKWHLGTAGGDDSPRAAGFERYAGYLHGELRSYEDWGRTVDGVTEQETGYATSVHVDDAVDWLRGIDGDPWMAWLAFTAPHEPFHVPPWRLTTSDLSGVHCDDDPEPCFQGALEALDTELERFLDKAGRWGEAPTVVLVGDNGSPHRAGAGGPGRAKGSLYQGGLHVPLCISGSGIEAGSEDGLAHVVDVYATVAEQFSVNLEEAEGSDSVSLLTGSRELAFAETWGLERTWLEGRAIRDERWKLLPDHDELYDLVDDPFEAYNLHGKQEGAEAQDRLEEALPVGSGR